MYEYTTCCCLHFSYSFCFHLFSNFVCHFSPDSCLAILFWKWGSAWFSKYLPSSFKCCTAHKQFIFTPPWFEQHQKRVKEVFFAKFCAQIVLLGLNNGSAPSPFSKKSKTMFQTEEVWWQLIRFVLFSLWHILFIVICCNSFIQWNIFQTVWGDLGNNHPQCLCGGLWWSLANLRRFSPALSMAKVSVSWRTSAQWTHIWHLQTFQIGVALPTYPQLQSLHTLALTLHAWKQSGVLILGI